MQRGGTGMRYNDRRNKRRVRIRPRFYIFLAIFLSIVAAAVFGIVRLVSALAGGGEAVVEFGMLEDTSSFPAILLRDETPVWVGPYETINYKVSENQNVQAETEIVEIYKGSTDDLLRDLEQEQKNLAAKQRESALGNIINEDLQELDNRLDQKSIEIQNFVQSGQNTARIVDLERELVYVMETKQTFLKTTQSTMQDVALQEIYQRIENLEKKISAYKDISRASRDGRVSFYLDGMEYFLNPSTLLTITATDADNMMKGATPEPLPPEEKAKAYIYRIVDPAKWYALITVRAKDWTLSTGQEIEIYFDGYEDTTYVAKIDSQKEDGDNLLVVLAMTEDIGPLINARVVTVKIGGRIEGMVVPLSAIKESNGVSGVTRADGTFVQVEVRGHDGVEALVMPVVEGQLTQNMRVLRK